MNDKVKQYTVPHCQHCTNYHLFTGNCLFLVRQRITSGSKGSAKAFGSRNCNKFYPQKEYKQFYEDMINKRGERNE